ncbi:MAG: ABC transporter permease [Bacteroidales bacterium]|nr:ABC transporter permease [Bacteroidales bacterium]
MVAERFISRKLKFQGNLAAVAIAVSFFVIIVAVAVSGGFRTAVREGVSALSGDVRIEPYASSAGADPSPMPLHLPSEQAIRALPGVADIQPAVIRPGIVKSGETVHGVVVKGIPGQADSTLTVSIPNRLAEITGLGVGDDLVTYFVGEKVRVRKFKITEIHRDLIEVDDNLLVYARMEDLQRLNGWAEDEISCLDVRLTARADRKEVAGRIGHILLNSDDPVESNLYISSSEDRYPQIFDWLGLLDMNVLVILILMTVVAGFNMVSGLLIMLLRNIPTIGTLKTLGMSDGAVGRLFIRIGARAVLKGMLWGNALALLFCLVQGTTHLIPLDPANYFVSWVPVKVDLLWILPADAAAFAGILLLVWLASRVVVAVDPAKTVKAD